MSRTLKETVLHSFTGSDGEGPEYTVTLDAKGNLYGTTPNGGANIAGVVFKIRNASAAKEPGPTFKVLHSFGSGSDGSEPVAGVFIDPEGNLYILTEFGGTFGDGALCKVVLMAEGETTEKVVHDFNSDVDGANPVARGTIVKVFDRNIYEVLADLLVGGTEDNGPGQGTIVVFFIALP